MRTIYSRTIEDIIKAARDSGANENIIKQLRVRLGLMNWPLVERLLNEVTTAPGTLEDISKRLNLKPGSIKCVRPLLVHLAKTGKIECALSESGDIIFSRDEP